ncbi:hypothetical protein CYMTET_44523 [Cymbomonas tetramitiformis]|uniref:ZZ-type domain-containing protein n=1 Tax=Cymbomonas tetramitiformis TaxID=36881 RepID=A0AAE0C195_9CHLO|nr:hypothetical protein CYMTET_44523 [Cymbomonas tetramitiformis]
METPATYTFKVSYADDLRRWTANRSVGYDELRAKICDIFDLPKCFTLKYQDEDGDIVTIGTECDLKECFAQKLSPIRLFVNLDAQSKTAEDEHSEPIYSKQVKGKAPAASEEPKAAHATEQSSDVPPSTSFINPLLSVLFRVCPDFDINAVIPKHTLDTIPDHVLNKFVSRADEVISGKTPPEKLLAEFFSTLSAEMGSTDTKTPSSSNPCSSKDLHTVLHHGVTCDGCGQSPIQGPRYKSLSKEDFDLCSTCEASKKPQWNGLYARLDKPDLTASGWTSMDKPEPIRANPDQGLNEPPFHPFKGMHPLRNRCRGFFRGGGGERRDGHHPHHWRRGGWAGKGGPASWQPYAWSPPGHYSASQPAYGAAQSSMPPSKSSPKPAPTPNEKLDSRFVSDVTVFDGTQVAPGQVFSKIWRLRNTGEVTWPKGTSLVHIGGDLMGLLAVGVTMPEGGVPPNTELDVHVEMTAPSRPGRYVTYYRLAVPSDSVPENTTPYRFGQRFWALIQVVDFDATAASAAGCPPPSPSSPPSAEATAAWEASLFQQPLCSTEPHSETQPIPKETGTVSEELEPPVPKAAPHSLPSELAIEDREHTKELPVELVAVEQENNVQKALPSVELVGDELQEHSVPSDVVEECDEDFPPKNVYVDSQVDALPEHLDQDEPPVMVKQDDPEGVPQAGDGIGYVPCLTSLYGAESSDVETYTPSLTPKNSSGDDSFEVLQADSDQETEPDQEVAIAAEAMKAEAEAAAAADAELAADMMPFALETQQLHDMGFNDMTRNIAILEKHNGDLLQTVEELMTSFPEDGADLEWENVSDSERFEEV